MKAQIDKVDLGFAPDLVDYAPQDGVFSDTRNIRFRDAAMEKTKGAEAVFGSLSLTPIWASHIATDAEAFWVYADENVVYGTNGTDHTQISSATYSADVDVGYTGGNFHGKMILNDGVVPPQVWDPGLANTIEELSHWPAMVTCDVIRPFADFLVAMRVTENGTKNPRLLRWSDIAGPGQMPDSWDFTDPTNSAGRTELGDTEDEIVDCLPLRDNNIVYKRFNTYIMQPIGGLDVFVFRQAFRQSGLLSENCVKAFGSHHFLVNDHDVILHNGSEAQSLADKRLRRWLFNRINPDRFERCFVTANYKAKEMWFFFPESGFDFPNLILAWDWSNNTFHVRDVSGPVAFAASGILRGDTSTQFDNLSGSFDDQSEPFDASQFTPFAQRLVVFEATAMAALQTEQGETLNGAAMTSYAIRDNIGLTRDVGMIKRIQRLFPKVYGTAGDVLDVYIGTRVSPDSAVTYSGPFSFTIGTDYKIDCRVSGRYITLRFESTATNSYRVAGFDIEFENDGFR